MQLKCYYSILIFPILMFIVINVKFSETCCFQTHLQWLPGEWPQCVCSDAIAFVGKEQFEIECLWWKSSAVLSQYY